MEPASGATTVRTSPRGRAAGERPATGHIDLVCEGGGVRGIALVGALSVLEEQGYRPHNVAGTSAGAIVATLLGAGYTAKELAEIIATLDFNRRIASAEK